MVATNETAELDIVGSRQGQVVVVTHHFRNTHVAVEHTLQELIDEWQTTCQTPFRAIVSSDYTLEKLVARHVCGSLPLDATVEESVALAGTFGGTTDQAPPWFACVVRTRTASAGRSRRGRFYLPVTFEENFNKDALQASYNTAVAAYCTALTNLFTSGGGAPSAAWRLVVHSRKLASVPGTQCQDASTLITTLAPQTVLTTQRSRRSRPA